MMDFFYRIFGVGEHLNILQMVCRAIVCFIIAIILIRIAGRRAFGLHITFDNVLAVLIGAVLSRAVVGASPFFPTIMACLALSLLHRLFAWIGMRNRYFERITKGEKFTLYKDGKFIKTNIEKSLLSHEDIMEAARLTNNSESLINFKEIYLERNGRISFIKKD
jgi:uncharacterized membrane protein YcaP (DUF421 family)